MVIWVSLNGCCHLAQITSVRIIDGTGNLKLIHLTGLHHHMEIFGSPVRHAGGSAPTSAQPWVY